MKQKYLILKNDEKNELIIKEFLEIMVICRQISRIDYNYVWHRT
jgi:hypothetical protein